MSENNAQNDADTIDVSGKTKKVERKGRKANEIPIRKEVQGRKSKLQVEIENALMQEVRENIEKCLKENESADKDGITESLTEMIRENLSLKNFGGIQDTWDEYKRPFPSQEENEENVKIRNVDVDSSVRISSHNQEVFNKANCDNKIKGIKNIETCFENGRVKPESMHKFISIVKEQIKDCEVDEEFKKACSKELSHWSKINGDEPESVDEVTIQRFIRLIKNHNVEEFGLSKDTLKKIIDTSQLNKKLNNVVALYNMGNSNAFYFMTAREARVAIKSVNEYRTEQQDIDKNIEDLQFYDLMAFKNCREYIEMGLCDVLKAEKDLDFSEEQFIIDTNEMPEKENVAEEEYNLAFSALFIKRKNVEKGLDFITENHPEDVQHISILLHPQNATLFSLYSNSLPLNDYESKKRIGNTSVKPIGNVYPSGDKAYKDGDKMISIYSCESVGIDQVISFNNLCNKIVSLQAKIE